MYLLSMKNQDIFNELRKKIIVCLDIIGFSEDMEEIVYFQNELYELSEEYKRLISKHHN